MQFFSQSPRLVWIHLALHSHEMEHLSVSSSIFRTEKKSFYYGIRAINLFSI